ncbi:hypothetical protein SEA_GREKAYCON_71 [Arthrobacter phage Grekaycon]|uniref:Uncharacterized protein n=3 Tax=Marthavirus martha TaxID=1980950 RepID=A0A514A5M4_9CAUD|nr:hypothetical protein TAEYOUNG_71 [Arthrobacter phage TaeYoung]QDH48561.1 hypothetical protein SEA_GREKAYCON_71 [Arthrobacter phage Grekaycon]QED11810.1 hypothetical protein SEA_BOSSLADY_72 [Arthrobacter phage BossLady]
MADYTGAVWIIGTHIDKATKELTELTNKREAAAAEVARLDPLIRQKANEIGDFAEARDLLMNPPAEPESEPTE